MVRTRYETLPEAERVVLRNALFRFVRDVIPAVQQPAFIKNKLCVVLVKMVKQDFPERWPTFFTDLLVLVRGDTGTELCDVFLRVLKILDEEVVTFDEERTKEEVVHNSLIKDTLTSQCMHDIIECMHSVLLMCHARPDKLDLARSCLETLSEYIGWVNLELVGNQRFVSLLYQLMEAPALQELAVDCLAEVVYKRMPPDRKVALLKSLDVIPVLAALPLQGQRNQPFLVSLAQLVNTLGLQLLGCTELGSKVVAKPSEGADEAVDAEATELLDHVMTLGYRFLGHEDFTVCEEMSELYLTYTNAIKTSGVSTINSERHFRQIFRAIAVTIRYPEWYFFQRGGDREAAFDHFRMQGPTRIFINMVRCSDELTLNLLKEFLTEALGNASGPQVVEGVLQLLYLVAEGVRRVEPLIKSDLRLKGMLETIFSHAPADAHPQVQIQFFRCAHRFVAVFELDPSLLPSVMTSFMDHRGINNVHPTVRSQACYMLLKLVKQFSDPLKRELGRLTAPMLEALHAFVAPFLLTSATELTELAETDDCLYLVHLPPCTFTQKETHTHTHTHTRARTHIYTHTHTHTHANTHTRKHTHTQTNT
jgi:exportin-T